MSRETPIFGLDLSGWNKGIDLTAAKNEGYEFSVAKATEGPYLDGTNYLNPLYRKQIKTAEDAGMVVGAYHYIVETDPKAQVDLFLKTVGEVEGKLLMIDYEAYNPPYQYLSPTMLTLAAFVRELQSRVGDHPVIVYSGKGYWESPPPNGPVTGLGVVTWDANYPYEDDPRSGPELYDEVKDWDQAWGERWGGQEPMFWQFSGSTPAGGLEKVDVNAFRGTMDELVGLASATKRKPDEGDNGKKVQGRIAYDEEDWALDPESGFWLRARLSDGYLYRERPAVVPPPPDPGPDPAPTRQWPQANDPVGYLGDGSYVDLHPTRYAWNADVEGVARHLVDNYDCWVNTYVDHPPGWGLDSTSLDIWGPAGRGDDIWSGNGDAGFWDVFNNGLPPWIRWCIRDGYIWDDYNGWRVFWETDPWSDGGHWRHRHVTFYG